MTSRTQDSNPAIALDANITSVASETDPPAPWPRVVMSVRLSMLAIVMQAALIGGFVWLVQTINQNTAQVHAKLSDSTKQTERLAKQNATLVAKNETLTREVHELRQFLASRTEEDIIFLKILVIKPKVDPGFAREVSRTIHHYAGLYGADPDLIIAMIAVESGFNPEAVSHMGAQGLMQVMPQWKKVLGIDGDLRDPDTSIKYGMQILGFYREMYKDLEMALTAYNRGPGPVDAALMKGKDPTNKYAPWVMRVYNQLKNLNIGATT